MPTWHEDKGLVRVQLAALDQPLPEVIGIVGKGAHPARDDIEYMPVVICRVGKTTTRRSRFLDQRDSNVKAATQQPDGKERATRATANDENREGHRTSCR